MKNQNDLVISIASAVVALAAILFFAFTQPAASPPAAPTTVNTSDPKLPAGDVQYADSLPGGSTGGNNAGMGGGMGPMGGRRGGMGAAGMGGGGMGPMGGMRGAGGPGMAGPMGMGPGGPGMAGAPHGEK